MKKEKKKEKKQEKEGEKGRGGGLFKGGFYSVGVRVPIKTPRRGGPHHRCFFFFLSLCLSLGNFLVMS